MFKKWFQSKAESSHGADVNLAWPALDAVDVGLAVEILQNASSLMPLSASDALLVAEHMQSRRYIFDEVLVRAGDKDSCDYMLWILEGQALIEAVSSNPQNPVTMTVLEPGSTMGEMGLLDGQARSATCTACSHMRCAMLTRQSLLGLAARHPAVATKLMLIISAGMATRLRDVTEKFRRYVLMANAIRDELMASGLPVVRPAFKNGNTGPSAACNVREQMQPQSACDSSGSTGSAGSDGSAGSTGSAGSLASAGSSVSAKEG